ncbi:hypothetical protein FQZ97_1093300 [compost metagenome]
MRADHPRHRTVGIACQDVAAVFDPEVLAVLHAAAILGLIAGRPLAQVVVKHGHHPRVVLGVDEVLPGQDVVVQGVRRIAEHLVPPRRAVDETGVGVPVPDPVADQLQDGVQHVVVHVRHVEFKRLDTRCLTHLALPAS